MKNWHNENDISVYT